MQSLPEISSYLPVSILSLYLLILSFTKVFLSGFFIKRYKNIVFGNAVSYVYNVRCISHLMRFIVASLDLSVNVCVKI